MFSKQFNGFKPKAILERFQNTTKDNVLSVLNKPRPSFDDFPILISSAAAGLLEEMSIRSKEITQQRFGNVMQLYIPLYLSSKCTGGCVYCGFNQGNNIKRATLSVKEALKEADSIYKMGFRNILLVSGTTKDVTDGDYLQEIVEQLAQKFSSVSIETQELTDAHYKKLVASHLDGVTLYQETYNRKVYEKVHPYGSKRDFDLRVNTMDRAGKAGVRKLSVGALLGLANFEEEALSVAFHCNYLMKKYWRSSISVSFPRLRSSESGYKPKFPVSHKQLAQMVFAVRIVFPDLDLNLSTRESPKIRNLLAQTGVTYMSAGSNTSPGGYTKQNDSGKQFELEDTRSVEDICKDLNTLGLDVVWKDWNQMALI